jgi:hypothetical protein
MYQRIRKQNETKGKLVYNTIKKGLSVHGAKDSFMRDVSKVCKSTRRTKDKANPCPLKEEEDRCKAHHHVDSSKLSRVSTQLYSGEASRVDKKKLMLGVHGAKRWFHGSEMFQRVCEIQKVK